MITLSKLMIYLLHKAGLLQNCLSDIFRALSFTSPYLMQLYLHAHPSLSHLPFVTEIANYIHQDPFIPPVSLNTGLSWLCQLPYDWEL